MLSLKKSKIAFSIPKTITILYIFPGVFYEIFHLNRNKLKEISLQKNYIMLKLCRGV
jgi:hypothetical protein